MALTDVIARLSVELALDSREFATGSTDAQRHIRSLGDRMKALGEQWTQAGKRLSIGVTAPLAAFGIMAAKTASDAVELQSAFDITFGEMSGMMNKWAVETGDALGRSTQSMQEMANTFGIFFNQAAPTREEAAEMSKTFSVLAQDLSSFYNVSGDVALQKLRSGLSGESEPLRDFGVFLTEAVVKAKALELGLGDLSGEISEQDKILARYQLILEGTRDAQGNVLQTSGDTANQVRAFTEALDELRVVIGERLLPILTPLINAGTRLVNGFNSLPPAMQTTIVAVGALAASIGPMMLIMGTLAATILPLFAAKFGVVGLAISAFVNPLGTAISFLAKFALELAGMTILKTIGSLLLRFAGPLGLVATAGYLIYQNWDKIVSLFQRFWAQAKQALGPPLQELVATITDKFGELWSGPLGEDIRSVMGVLQRFAGILAEVFGDAVVATIKSFLDVILGVLRTIGDAIRFVNALLKGDWQAAWDAAASIVTRIIEPFRVIATSVIGIVQAIYRGVKSWLGDRLAAVLDTVSSKVEAVEEAFAWLYDRVIGNSWVPDMVDGIASQMSRLDQVMVRPAERAATATSQAMREMAGEVRQLLDRLFPEVRRILDYRDDLSKIEGSDLSDAQKEEAQRRAGYKLAGIGNRLPGVDLGAPNAADVFSQAYERTIDGLKRLTQRSEQATVRIAKSFKDMADETLGALSRLRSAIEGGGFLGILESVIGLGLQLGSIGAFGSKIAGNINRTVPGYALGTNSAARGLALVGERGPELVRFRGGEQLIPNDRLGGMQRVEIVPSPYFDVVVDGRVQRQAPRIAAAGAQGGVSRMAHLQSWTLK